MESRSIEKPEYTVLYLFSFLFLISLIDSLTILAIIAAGSIIYYLLYFKDIRFYRLIFPVLPFIVLMLVPNLLNFFIIKSFEVSDFTIMIISKVTLSALTLGLVLKKYSSLYMVEGILNIGFPPVLNRIMALTFRYFHMIYRDVQIGQTALYSRGLKNRKIIDSFQIWGEWIGGFFLKSSVHSEKVYEAMKARGFTGESHGSFFKRRDLCLRLILIICFFILIKFLNWRYL